MSKSIADIRTEYLLKKLDKRDLHVDPFIQFAKWFEESINADVMEPNAFSLATCGRSAYPECRTVLLKGFSELGLVFFTNYESEKGLELSQNPKAGMLFFWPELQRQIRITGDITKVSTEESDNYFHSRPRGSQIGAWASHQSAVLHSREELLHKVHEVEHQYEGQEIPRPTYWGGYLLKPTKFEFWQGRENRLHDRFRYSQLSEKHWQIERLSP